MLHKEEEYLQKLRRERTVRVKRILRWMPRRTNIHRYPVLKWFGDSAKKRLWLWSFRPASAVPAIYAGCILAFLPLYGIQIPLAILLGFILRANLPILISLQWITNPLTAFPIYFTAYHIARLSMHLFGVHSPALTTAEIKHAFSSFESDSWTIKIDYLAQVFGYISLGGIMMGLFCATILSLVYKLGAKEVAITYEKLHAIQERRKSSQSNTQPPPQPKQRFPKKKRKKNNLSDPSN